MEISSAMRVASSQNNQYTSIQRKCVTLYDSFWSPQFMLNMYNTQTNIFCNLIKIQKIIKEYIVYINYI